MSGPDQNAQPYQPHRPQDGAEADEPDTTVVDARALGADESAHPAPADVPQAWSDSAQDSAPTTATPYPRAYRPVDEDDPTDAPLADTPGTFGGAPRPESADERVASPYAARPTDDTTAGSTPSAPTADDSPDGDRHGDLFPSSGYAGSEQTTSVETTSVQPTSVQPTSPRPSPEQAGTGTGSTEGPGSTAAYQPFQSTAQPAVAPFPSGSTSGATRSDDTAARGAGSRDSTAADTPDDATRALPQSDPAEDPFARPYPAAAEPIAQPEYIPPPPQPAAVDERDTFIGQPARPEEPDLLPPKRRIWQNLLGALIGLVLVLGPIVGFALLAGTPDSLFDAAVARRFLLLGIIVVAAAPALLAGWAPATAWVPGAILAVGGAIAFLSDAFVLRLRSWSRSLFDTEVAGIFLAQYAVVIGFVLLFAGLGTAWARSSGADAVIRRIPTRS